VKPGLMLSEAGSHKYNITRRQITTTVIRLYSIQLCSISGHSFLLW